MSGAVAAHAAYNGSGTQGLAVTNKIHDDDGDVMSVFWNKNDTTRQLLYGSSIIEIPASGSGGNLGAGGNQNFTVNNDIDALGDLYLQISTSGISSSVTLSSLDLLKCIKRVEFMVGTQVWQTLEAEDIIGLNMTEMSEDAFESFTLAMTGGFASHGKRNTVTTDDTKGELSVATSGNITGVLRIPALSRSYGPRFAKYTDISENSYLLAAAPHQTVKIRVYMVTSPKFGGAAAPTSLSFNLKLFGQCIVMCNEEREQMKAMPMGLPKRLKMTQNTNKVFTWDGTTVPMSCTLDLDHFSLYASHIILVVTNTGTSITNSSIDTVELKLNSSSFSGTLDGALLTGSAADALGLFSNGFFIGSANYADNYYVFPLASLAYGGSSVPLNRFDNIRMDVSVVLSGTGNFTLSATCVGETTALYKGGAASLAMY
jgi:hypothetical protein